MIKYNYDLVQGSDEWLSARCGLLTASEVKLIITPETNKFADNEKSRAHLWELAAQRITGYVEPHYVSDDMLRGMVDEIEAKNIYIKHYAEVKSGGFVTNNSWGFTLGYSPDGLVGEDGQIECKSRRQKFQIQTIISDQVPTEYLVQIQTGLLVTQRSWCDFISYSAGLPLYVKRVPSDPGLQDKILLAAQKFYDALNVSQIRYKENISKSDFKLIPTERKKLEVEITL